MRVQIRALCLFRDNVFDIFLFSMSNFINFVEMDNKTIISQLAERLERDPEDVAVLIDSLSEVIVSRVMQGDSVTLPGFGLFEAKLRAERVASHPSTGKKILVPPKQTIVFRPSALLKQKVRKS